MPTSTNGTRIYFAVPTHYTIGETFGSFDAAVAAAHATIKPFDGIDGFSRAFVDVRENNGGNDQSIRRYEVFADGHAEELGKSATELTDFQREALDKFLALPDAHDLIQAVIVASKIGTTTTFKPNDRPVFALVSYGGEAHAYKHAVEGVKQAIGIAQAGAQA